ncbi:MAG: glycosyltransferase family 2 protein [Bacteroidota bacterium]
MSKKSISIVIPTFNGKELLAENIPFLLKALEFSKIDFEILLCDDASKDETLDFISSTYPTIKILKSEENKGFSPTINLGIFAAQKDLIFLLNNDVKLSETYFEEQFKYFKHSDTFGVMGKIIGTSGETQDTAKFPDYVGIKIKGSTNFELLEEQRDFWIPSFMLSGANTLVDRKKIQLLNGFDEIYAPFYWEDVDLSLRAWRLGWKCYYEANAICTHPTSSTIGKLFKKKDVNAIANRNKFIFHTIHLEKNKLFSYKLKLALKLLLFKKSFKKSYSLFKAKKSEIAKSQHDLFVLSQITGNLFSTEEVRNEILQKIAPFKIRKF